MIASIHVADVGIPGALKLLASKPQTGSHRRAVPGLRDANIAIGAPLTPKLLPSPDLKRVGLFAFWDDEAALDRFESDHATARALADGWSARLEPLRAHGSWPGLPSEVPKTRVVNQDGPLVVFTLGRLRTTQTLRFGRASASAEAQVLAAPGMIWASGFSRPPFVATCSIWESTDAVTAYAYGTPDAGHPTAIATGVQKPFHKQEVFIRFRPVATSGTLHGTNPIPASFAVGGAK